MSSEKKESKQCQNCKKDFVIEQEDFNFYEKIKVPPPTFCPECRLQRRLSFRNERSLYKAVCDLCKENTFSVLPNGKRKIYCVSCWVSDKWDGTDYGVNYDFSKSFFEQFKELIQRLPNRALSASSVTLVNSEYSNTSGNLKDCYLIYGSENCQNCMYCTEVFNSFDCLDCKMVNGSNVCYASVNCQKCSRVNYSVDCHDCFDVSYSRNLSNCSNCFGCSNLNNKSYCIFNKSYSREAYLLEIGKYQGGSYLKMLENKKITREFINKFPVKFYHGFKNNKVTGDYIYNSKNTINSFIVTGAENCKYCFNLVLKNSKGCFDYSDWGGNTESIYESLSCGNNVNSLISSFFIGKNSMNIEYSGHCANCQNVFGCFGLRNKQYCIFNKQYGKGEYFELVEKIKKQMDEIPYVDKNGCVYKYGEFFPTEISIFPYNNSTAQDYFPLSQEEAIKKGFSWIEKIDKNYRIDIPSKDLVDNIKEAEESILEKVIGCENVFDKIKNVNCTGAFRIIPRELSFYKKEGIPLPHYCPNCRNFEMAKNVNQPKLWHRSCMKEGCQNEFKTSYAPERPEIVYCEKCYQQEVY